MDSERQNRRDTAHAITQRLIAPNLVGDQITGIPILFGISMLWCGLIPPHSRAKLYAVLGFEMLSVVWAGWLYVLWRRRSPKNANDPAMSQAWRQYSTLIYHLARASTFYPASLGALTASLLAFSFLQVKSVQILLVVGYGATSLILWANRHQLLRISVEGIQNETWRKIRSGLMILGVGLAGIGAALGTLVSRIVPMNIGMWLLGLTTSTFALPLLAYGFLEAAIVRAFIAKSER